VSAEGSDNKYKGTGRHGPRQGMGRLRKAAESSTGRQKGWARHAEDEEFLDREAPTIDRGTHVGENLLARFNRVARDITLAPDHALTGRVSGFAGRSIIVRLADGSERTCDVRQALLKQFTGVRNPLVVGDRVLISSTDDVIEAVSVRDNILARADSHNRSLLHQLAANVDVLVVVTAMEQPDFKPAFLDRYLLIAASNDIPALIVFNKADIAEPGEAAERYRKIGYEVHVTSAHVPNHPSLDILRASLHNRTAVIAGQSGVGKSSLLNALHPGLVLRIGDVSNDTGKGRHTTTSARSIPIPGGGEIIDTPGIRECGITGLDALSVALFFPEIARFHGACRFNDCTHRHEPDCAVAAAMERGDIHPARYDSYVQIISEDLGA
jgi:ribosome biogenesis GTPase / thiamine phosphate phosphatase